MHLFHFFSSVAFRFIYLFLNFRVWVSFETFTIWCFNAIWSNKLYYCAKTVALDWSFLKLAWWFIYSTLQQVYRLMNKDSGSCFVISRAAKRVERAKYKIVCAWFEDLTSLKSCSSLGHLSRRSPITFLSRLTWFFADTYQSWTSRVVQCSILIWDTNEF